MNAMTVNVTLNGHRTHWKISGEDGHVFTYLTTEDIETQTNQEIGSPTKQIPIGNLSLRDFWRMLRDHERQRGINLQPTKRDEADRLDPLWAIYDKVYTHEHIHRTPTQENEQP